MTKITLLIAFAAIGLCMLSGDLRSIFKKSIRSLLSLREMSTFGAPGKLLVKCYKVLVVMGEESLMSKKEHGTTAQPPQQTLRYNVDWDTADKICCFNRHYAEHSGYFLETSWLKDVSRT